MVGRALQVDFCGKRIATQLFLHEAPGKYLAVFLQKLDHPPGMQAAMIRSPEAGLHQCLQLVGVGSGVLQALG
jgi:hypothetical protein